MSQAFMWFSKFIFAQVPNSKTDQLIEIDTAY